MPKIRASEVLAHIKVKPAHADTIRRVWRGVSGGVARAIADEANQDIRIFVFGAPGECDAAIRRLAMESPSAAAGIGAKIGITAPIRSGVSASQAEPSEIVIPAEGLAAGEVRTAAELIKVVQKNRDRRLALARNVPAFRSVVSAKLIQETSWENTRIAVLTALPGVVPLTDFLLPLTAAGDMAALTRNQLLLLLRISAAYGKDVDLRARARELLPVVGSAFGWRALARELLAFVPGGVGVVVKGAVAYAGTYTVGKSADIFYSTGSPLSKSRMKQLYRDAFKAALPQLRSKLKRKRKIGRLVVSDSAPKNDLD